MVQNVVVPEALNNDNYEIWSNCMEVYLLSQDLWDMIEPETKADSWSKRRNASALHAIHMSCGNRAILSKICKLKSAKEAWDVLKSMNQQSHGGADEHTNEKKKLDNSSHTNQVIGGILPFQVNGGIGTKSLPTQLDGERVKSIQATVRQGATEQSTTVKAKHKDPQASTKRKAYK